MLERHRILIQKKEKKKKKEIIKALLTPIYLARFVKKNITHKKLWQTVKLPCGIVLKCTLKLHFSVKCLNNH